MKLLGNQSSNSDSSVKFYFEREFIGEFIERLCFTVNGIMIDLVLGDFSFALSAANSYIAENISIFLCNLEMGLVCNT